MQKLKNNPEEGKDKLYIPLPRKNCMDRMLNSQASLLPFCHPKRMSLSLKADINLCMKEQFLHGSEDKYLMGNLCNVWTEHMGECQK